MTKEKSLYAKDPQAAYEQAKEFYFNYVQPSKIVELVGVNKQTLSTWINGLRVSQKISWKDERNKLMDETLAELYKNSAEEIQACQNISLALIKERLMKAYQSGEEISLNQIEKIGSLFERMVRNGQLIAGKPTEVFGYEIKHTDIFDAIADIQQVEGAVDYLNGKDETEH